MTPYLVVRRWNGFRKPLYRIDLYSSSNADFWILLKSFDSWWSSAFLWCGIHNFWWKYFKYKELGRRLGEGWPTRYAMLAH